MHFGFFFVHRNENDGFTGKTAKHSHSVIVVNSILQSYIREKVTQYDQIFLEGYISYKSLQLHDGSKHMYGSILPVYIEKIDSTTSIDLNQCK